MSEARKQARAMLAAAEGRDARFKVYGPNPAPLIALMSAAPDLIETLCYEADAAERRAVDAEAGAAAWEVRPFVLAFALKMEAKLKSRDVQRGSRGWWSAAHRDLFAYLIAEVDELEATLEHGMEMDTVGEAVDVANFAMMIADVSGMDSYSVASGMPGRAILDRLERAESERDKAVADLKSAYPRLVAERDAACAKADAAESDRDANRTAAENACAAQLAAESERDALRAELDAAALEPGVIAVHKELARLQRAEVDAGLWRAVVTLVESDAEVYRRALDASRAIAENAYAAQLAAESERDALRAELEKESTLRDDLAAKVRRLKGRTAVACECVTPTWARGDVWKKRIRPGVWASDDCRNCHGSGAVIVEGT